MNRFSKFNHFIFFVSLFSINGFGQNTDTSKTLDRATPAYYFKGDIFENWCGGPVYYSKWSNGISSDQNFFPISIWLQSPENTATAKKYKEIGINMYIGLHRGPTESQLSAVANLGTTVFCTQNTVGLESKNKKYIKAWTHIDEPDNAQNGTQQPLPARDIIEKYTTMKEMDPTRPIYLNLGGGVACEAWYGRGDRTNHPEDYTEYAKGADIVSFDIYPMNTFPRPASDPSWLRAFNNVVSGDISYVGRGVDNLRKAVNNSKPVWVWIECTNIDGDHRYALTPTHVKAEVWMSIIHGARGIGYFCHEFSPFVEAGLLKNQEMTDSVRSINSKIIELAPVLNTKTVKNGATVSLSDKSVVVDILVKRHNNSTYVFAVATKSGTATATFKCSGFMGNSKVEVVSEGREITMIDGVFQDDFSDYDVHIYKISHPTSSVGNIKNNEINNQRLQCFQNASDNLISIKYYLPSPGIVKINLNDLSGKEIAALINGSKSEGTHQITFNAGNLNLVKGVYIINMKTENNQNAIKITYSK
ncbi:MAG: T9SS type A sorting domain-containing protein [Bacteroidales bacterium]|nr:T9SS type A sorting domain-containing protein [Bacteroidales bacterium]